MEEKIQEILITEEQIRQKVAELGKILTRDYAGKDLVIVGVLKGVTVFFSDMIRAINLPCQIDFMWLSSYSGVNGGKMLVRQDVTCEIEGRDVLILEDIFDTGRSLQYTVEHLMSKNPASLKICTLLDKPSRRVQGVTVKADYVGFEVPDAFVVGYGLDFNEYYRNLPYVGVLKPEAYL